MGRFDTYDGFNTIYDTSFGPALKKLDSERSVPEYIFVSALLSKIEDYNSAERLVEEEPYTIEQLGESLEFDRTESYSDPRKNMERSGLTEIDK